MAHHSYAVRRTIPRVFRPAHKHRWVVWWYSIQFRVLLEHACPRILPPQSLCLVLNHALLPAAIPGPVKAPPTPTTTALLFFTQRKYATTRGGRKCMKPQLPSDELNLPAAHCCHSDLCVIWSMHHVSHPSFSRILSWTRFSFLLKNHVSKRMFGLSWKQAPNNLGLY